MPKRKNNQNQSENDSSPLIEFAKSSVNKIVNYAESNIEEDRLIAFNAILTLISLDFIITGLLLPNSTIILNKIIVLVLFGIIAAAICGLYLYLIVAIATVIKKDTFALKLSIAILIFVSCLSLSGLFLPNQNFIEYSLILIFIQVILTIVIGFFKIPIKVNIKQSESQGSNIGIIFWNILDKISIVGGVLGLIVLIYPWIPIFH